jgi:hypothetical protein
LHAIVAMGMVGYRPYGSSDRVPCSDPGGLRDWIGDKPALSVGSRRSVTTRLRECVRNLANMTHSFVPDDYVVPLGLAGPGFRLEPLGPQHNDADHRAWTASIEHIRATPGLSTWRWPPADGMSLDENLGDLRRHADDLKRRVGFTYTVLDDEDVVVGCVYIYPSRQGPNVTEVRSWVTAGRAELDSVVHDTVDSWLAADWPFTNVRYRSRV